MGRFRSTSAASATQPPTSQASFPGPCLVADALERLAGDAGTERRGAIYTRREVVDFILDLVGYTTDAPLTDFRLLEPSCGDGDFLLPAVERLLSAAARMNLPVTHGNLSACIRAVELHRATCVRLDARLRKLLERAGASKGDADRLVDAWLRQGDFLLAEFDHRFSHVVGNPPYVRHESIPDVLMKEYRRRYETIHGRADLYVPFIERSLRLLDDDGRLGFICADRWMKNEYGRRLRELVSRDFGLRVYVDMVDTDAFHTEVSAYPAITVINRSRTPTTRVFARPAINATGLHKLAEEIASPKLTKRSKVREVEDIVINGSPWVLDAFDELRLARRLEAEFPTLGDAGCRIGIGVATGADDAFIGDYESLDVERSRKLPLVTTRDILTGRVEWQGRGVVNPFDTDGKLVRLEDYPRLRAHLEARKERIAGRHVAIKAPWNWYRTIDRIHPSLAEREKLLIPDIKGDASIVYESGTLYPHHNLYFITSDEWDVPALQAVIGSGIARLFVSLYSTRMRGGYLRFQAQHLRRIRIPRWRDVGPALRKRLAAVAKVDDPSERNAIVSELYGLGAADMKLVEGARAS